LTRRAYPQVPRPLRILQVSEAAGGGVLQVISELSAGLHAAGHEVSVAYGVRPETPENLASLLPEGVGVYPLSWMKRSIPVQLKVGVELRRLVRTLEPDVVHLHSSFAGLVGSLCVPRGIPIVYSPHAYAFSRSHEPRVVRGIYLAIEMLTARRSSMIGAISHAEADLARSVVHAPRVVTVSNGISDLRGPPSGAGGVVLAPDRERVRPRVVAMGRLAAQHRPEESTAILSALRDEAEVEWVGGGVGDEDAPLRAAGVSLTGWLDRDEALSHLDGATVYLHWSLFDGQPLAILEALARDVVVVASDIPANRELVGPHQVAATVQEATDLARRVLVDPAFREELLVQQRRRRGRWSSQRMTDRWLEVYRHVARAA
jgi:glycosyltransferase involved in cell wall biosynthesis